MIDFKSITLTNGYAFKNVSKIFPLTVVVSLFCIVIATFDFSNSVFRDTLNIKNL